MSSSIFLYDYLAEVAKYNDARTAIEACFEGLPHAISRLVNLLITRANPESGIVENITYSDLASTLTVNAAPGRKDSGTPQKQTIRSYLRTIQSQCGDHFKIISDGQALKIQLPTLPAIYASHFESTEVYTDKNKVFYTATTPTKIEGKPIFEDEFNTEEYTEPYTADLVAPINAHAIKPNFQPNNNNSVSEELVGIKKPISDDFYPSQFAIDKALSLGFSKATDPDELRKFILFNQANGSIWRNYDYVFIMWAQSVLEREKAQKAKAEQPKTKHTYSRSDSNEQRQTPSERVIAMFTQGGGLEFNQTSRRFNRRGAAHQPATVRMLSVDDLGPVN